MKKQNKKIFYYRDLLEKHLKKKELEALLEHNDQEIPAGQVPVTTANQCCGSESGTDFHRLLDPCPTF
jgi:hypothetical protein